MEKQRRWHILVQTEEEVAEKEVLQEILLQNRRIETQEEKQHFLSPDLKRITADSIGINEQHADKAISLIQQAKEKNEQVVIYGDYDVDGITAAAILWELMRSIGIAVMPYIPHRIEEGYGLSEKGIDQLLRLYPGTKVIVTVDNGIVALSAVQYAKEKGIQVIITDHHVPGEKLPLADAIIHSTNMCGAGVAWVWGRKLYKEITKKELAPTAYLDLVALGTVADLVPLTKENRIVVAKGLALLQHTTRKGLLALYQTAGLNPSHIDTYAIGHIIAPRLNAMGRLESAMDSLRLLCTTDEKRAFDLAQKLEITNKRRQVMTKDMTDHAVSQVTTPHDKHILVIADPSYEQGVVGLIAGRLVETFYLPSIVLSIGETVSKASARSISGFDMVSSLREVADLLIDVGGHPMAAGFTIANEHLELFEARISQVAKQKITEDMRRKNLVIDLVLHTSLITMDTYMLLQQFAPFGMANFEPVFLTQNLILVETKTIGKEGKHAKIIVQPKNAQTYIEGIAFGMGEKMKQYQRGDILDVVYTLDQNVWNGNTKLQIKVKDIRKTE